MPRTPWAIYDAAGKIVFIDLSTDEYDVWQTYLGWPDKSEIDYAKANGLTAKAVEVHPIVEATPHARSA